MKSFGKIGECDDKPHDECFEKATVLPKSPNTFYITKTYLYNFDPLKPHFYIVKLGFAGDTLFFLFLLKIIGCGTR